MWLIHTATFYHGCDWYTFSKVGSLPNCRYKMTVVLTFWGILPVTRRIMKRYWIRMSHVSYEWVISYEWVMSLVNESCLLWMSHVSCEWVMSLPCLFHEWVLSLTNESCPLWMSHVSSMSLSCLFHVSYEWVTSLTCLFAGMRRSGKRYWQSARYQIPPNAVQVDILKKPTTTLLYTATHSTRCNTLQHTATHCNTLPQTIRPCQTLPR